MIHLAFDDLNDEQALAILSAYRTVKPAASNVIPFPTQPTAVETREPITHHIDGTPAYSQAPATLVNQPAPELPVAPPAAVVPTAATPTYTYEDLARAAAPLMDAGKTPELQALLRSFNVQALTQLPKDQYGAFATALRGMGARI